jgi:hypothetical protein
VCVINHADDDVFEESLGGNHRQMLIAPYMPPIDGIFILTTYIHQSL